MHKNSDNAKEEIKSTVSYSREMRIDIRAAYLYLFSCCRIGGIVVRTGGCAVGIPGKYDGANGRPIIDLTALGVLANLTLIGSVKPRKRISWQINYLKKSCCFTLGNGTIQFTNRNFCF